MLLQKAVNAIAVCIAARHIHVTQPWEKTLFFAAC